MHNSFWLGTPHIASKDFAYKGQFTPKDMACVLNTWSMHYNSDKYPEPEKFNVSGASDCTARLC